METARAIGGGRHTAKTVGLSRRRRSLRPNERQKLLVEHLPEVRHIARRIHVRLPPHVPFEDLVHSGVLGLIDAVEKFDPSKNVPLSSYAQFRIRGAILDGLRQLDESPRDLRRKARRFEQAHDELAAKLGRTPSEMEIAAYLGLQVNEFQLVLGELHGASAGKQCGHADLASRDEGGKPHAFRVNEDPFQLCARSEIAKMLKEAIDTLGKKERRAVALYYYEERTMKEVARVLHVNESRVSQIVTASVNRLRSLLKGRLHAREKGTDNLRTCMPAGGVDDAKAGHPGEKLRGGYLKARKKVPYLPAGRAKGISVVPIMPLRWSTTPSRNV
jgi:RNA polymerase sigma factor FliA